MERYENLHPNVKSQLAMVKRDLKAQSKNHVVRVVLGLLVELAVKDKKMLQLEKELSAANGFIGENEGAFQAYLEKQKLPDEVDIKPKEEIPDEPA